MVKYKDIFGTVRMFPFWKDAILYAKERMAMVMDGFEDYQPKIAKRALDDFKDLCVLEHMYTEEEIQEIKPNLNDIEPKKVTISEKLKNFYSIRIEDKNKYRLIINIYKKPFLKYNF
jgi:mRNA-degrading endonuclease RelE of RelBE toxin-antitoxin system